MNTFRQQPRWRRASTQRSRPSPTRPVPKPCRRWPRDCWTESGNCASRQRSNSPPFEPSFWSGRARSIATRTRFLAYQEKRVSCLFLSLSISLSLSILLLSNLNGEYFDSTNRLQVERIPGEKSELSVSFQFKWRVLRFGVLSTGSSHFRRTEWVVCFSNVYLNWRNTSLASYLHHFVKTRSRLVSWRWKWKTHQVLYVVCVLLAYQEERASRLSLCCENSWY